MLRLLCLFLISLISLQLAHAQQYALFKDSRDGKVYKTVKIGKQEWMAENLNSIRFRNGDLIPQAKTKEEWISAGKNRKPAWCFYNNDPKYAIKYGRIYNGFAVIDPRGLAPIGWDIPSNNEWKELIHFLGGIDESDETGGYENSSNRVIKGEIAHKLKNEQGWGWFNEGCNGNNFSGFSAIPGGARNGTGDGNFSDQGYGANWWSSQVHFESEGKNIKFLWSRSVACFGENVHRSLNNLSVGLYIRCVKQ